jgi:hypothetical protein
MEDAMPNYLIFNTVNSDGVGDFSHFEDIIKTLLANPKFNDVEFIPIVCFKAGGTESNYRRVGEKLKALGIPFIYGKDDDHKRFSSDPAIQKQLNEADQAIVISYDTIFGKYQPYLKPDIPIKSISEHESIIYISGHKNHIPHPLGLGLGKKGIKIKDATPTLPNDEWNIIKQNDPDVATQLLACTHSPDFENFYENYLVTPAYFNRPSDFVAYLHLFGVNQSLSKNVVVYLSGISHWVDEQEQVTKRFMNTSIQQIETYRPGNSIPEIIPGNPDGTRAIKILTGFYLTNPSFDAIYRLSKIAGVSGDNTLERCISMNVLPFYWSWNPRMKMPTLSALQYMGSSLILMTYFSGDFNETITLVDGVHFYDALYSNGTRATINGGLDNH